MFRYIAVLACALGAIRALSPELKEQFMEAMMEGGEKCAPKVGASQDDIAELIAKKVPTRHEGKCLVFCLYNHFGLLDENGNGNEEAALKAMEPLKADDPDLYDKVIKVGRKCHESVAKGSDNCQYAVDLVQCGVKEGKAMGIDDAIFD